MAWQGYKIVGKLGEGGMATVYKAMQESLQRPVAIKILASNLKDHPDIQARFDKESLIIAQLNHPHIIHVIDRGVTGKGRPYFVMEYVEGMTLEEAINRDKLDEPRKLEALSQVCKALGYAHKNGVIHRDIKPGNILLDRDMQARVVDFGIAQLFDGSLDVPPDELGIVGTNAYMAPELHESADAASVQSDLYAMGILMYELFTGVQPQGDIPPPTQFEPQMNPELSELIMHCLAFSPKDRPASIDDVLKVLLHLLRGDHLSKEQKDQAELKQPGVEGQFELLDVLKEDQFSSVYLYEDAARQKLIAVKKLPAGSTGIKEHRLLSRLSHDSIVPVLGVSSDDSHVTLVTEYQSGGSLGDQLLAPLEAKRVMSWGRKISEALVFAHKNGVFHGNLRPSNIIFDEYGSIKVGDFGLKPHYQNRSHDNWYEHPGLEGAQQDLFALGAILFQAITGQAPQYRNGQLIRGRLYLEQHPRVQEVLKRLLSSKADERYPTTEVVVAEIRGVLQQLEDQAEQSLQRQVKQQVQSIARQERRRQKKPLPWRRWLFWLLVLAVVAEELWFGFGRRELLPLLEPGWNAIVEWIHNYRDGGAYQEWTDKARKLLE